MNPRLVIGHLSRRSPRGRGRVGQWLHEHPGSGRLDFRDVTGHRRTTDLRDALEARWFAGERSVGLPSEVLAKVRRGDHVIDAGANIGVITGQLADAVGPTGVVDSFEPLPRNIEHLMRLCEDNSLTQVTVHPCALGAAAGTAELRLPGVGGGAYASFTASWIDEGRLTVDVRTIDDTLSADDRVAFIKIDVEGYEYEVLTGAARTLAMHKPLLFLEINHLILEDAGSSGAAFLATVERDFGYVVMPEHRHLERTAHCGLATLLFEARTRGPN